MQCSIYKGRTVFFVSLSLIIIHHFMQPSFLNRLESWQLMLILLALMIISILIGLIVGKKYHHKSVIESSIVAGVFALLGLMLAFNFGLSLTHYDNRRAIIIEEANDIGTTILRTNLYREPDGKSLRADLKRYVDARVGYFSAGAGADKIANAQMLSVSIQQQLWSKVAALSKDTGFTVASLQMIPSLNATIDIANTSFYANYVQLPDEIIYLLVLLSCASGFCMGFVSAGKEKPDWLMAGGASLLVSLVVAVNFDLDRPRRGFITLDQAGNSIMDLRQMFPVSDTAIK